jgi:hypothetical protein
VRKIKVKMGGNEWRKPRGMHQGTFHRLQTSLRKAEMRVDELFLEGGRKIIDRHEEIELRLMQ